MPVPMMPRAKSGKVKSPASGLSASAASVAELMLVMPWPFKTVAVVRMMKKANRIEKIMPTMVSTLMRSSSMAASGQLAKQTGILP
jgi:hypothetical protein